ncbi:ribosomal protection-like ABC-F family protein [Enterococcus massiliensis]|uniref:ribosomal protection-like ABC-F family protein n=1 Tax=Enterococcus massiliensis TaxID=1640685 RepID=UPI00065E9506|nr:ABC-F type ribosomal protection protein [Enterococcus massiliensis]
MELAVKLTDVAVTFGNKDIFQIDELTAYQNDRIGIVGGNGQGKSTLLNLIADKIQPDRGKIQRETTFTYFSQIALPDEAETELDGELLGRMKVPTNSITTLSGGEGSKLRLTQALTNYQLGMLLDEPTTHLDRRSIDVLIEELNYYYGTLLFVSHDREFLNQLATKIWEVSEGKIREFNGNYDDYQQQKEQERLTQENAFSHYEQEKNRLAAAAQKKKEQAARMARVSDKKKKQNIRPGRLSSTKQKDTVQKAAQKTAKTIEKRLEQLETVQNVAGQRKIIFPPSIALTIHNKFPIMGDRITLIKGEKCLLEQASFQFPLGKKIALIGDNGTGKSSLLQYIQENQPGITLSPKVVFSTYQQMDYQLHQRETILSFLMKRTDYSESLVRSLLNNLGFLQTELDKSVQKLSGGEATRVSMALVFVKPANVLILDEPTNFIDLSTVSALERFLRAYPGTVLFTSHDPYFVKTVADEVYEIKGKQLKRRC